MQLIEKIKASKVFAEAMREIEVSDVQRRKDLVQKISAIDTAEAKDAASREKMEIALFEEAEALAKKLSEVRFKLGEARSDAVGVSLKFQSMRKELRQQLHATADPRLQQFINWADRARNLAMYASATLPIGWSGLSVMQEANRYPATVAAAALKAGNTIWQLIERAEAMKEAALFEADVTAALDEMARQVIDAYRAVPGARAYPADYRSPPQ